MRIPNHETRKRYVSLLAEVQTVPEEWQETRTVLFKNGQYFQLPREWNYSVLVGLAEFFKAEIRQVRVTVRLDVSPSDASEVSDGH